ncbi:MAG: NIP7 pre-PUA domain-containing protein [Candidatus Heimdallarchaeaceae archaeon]
MSNITVNFRKATKTEEEIVRREIDNHFGQEGLDSLQNRFLWIKDGKIKEVCALLPNIEAIAKIIPHNLYFAGIPIGSIKNNKFHLEIEGSALIRLTSKKVIHVKTDQFLYGKSIFTDNVLRFDEAFQNGDLVIIEGRNNVHYGVGETCISSEELKSAPSNTVIIRGSKNTPRDRGWYLRKGN